MVPRAATGYVSAMTLPRLLIVIGVVLVLIGLAWPFLSKLGLGKLPGDIVIRREGFSVYFPLVTCLIVSAALSLVLWLMRR